MKWLRNQWEDDLTPPPSSVDSGTSYELFSADCSDSDDGDRASERARQQHSLCYKRPRDDGMPPPATAAAPTTPLLSATTTRRSPSPAYRHAAYDSMNGVESSAPKEPDGREKKQQSSLVTIFSVWNTIMGSSLLTMAWGVERAGLAAALLLMPLMGGLCLYTAYVLLEVRRHHGTSSWEVSDLCRALLGRWVEYAARTFSLLVMLGANVVYWILMTNFLYYTVNYFTDVSSNSTVRDGSPLCPRDTNRSSLLIQPAPPPGVTPYWGLHTTVPVIIAFLIFPLLNFKKASFFTKFNSLGTLSVLYLLAFVVAKGWGWGVHMGSWRAELWAGGDAAVLSGMLALSFYIHNIIITIMSQNRRQEKNGRDLTISFALVTLTYVLIGTVFYICFPLAKNCIEDNILNNFEMHDKMSAVARVLLLFQVVTVYPLITYMLRRQTLDLAPPAYRHNTCAVLALNLLIVAICVLFACFCPNIGTIVRYTGAVSGLVHVFALPSMLQVRSLQLRGRLTAWKLLLYGGITVLGAVNLLGQFFISDDKIIR